MQLDVLALVTPDISIRQKQGLTGATPSWTYVSPRPDANGLLDLVYIKGNNVNPAYKGGYPWDWLKVGADYIYQLLTEYRWSDPTTGKLCRLLGQPRLPRWIDWSPSQSGPAQVQFTLQFPQTNYVIIDAGGMNTATPGGSSDGDVRCTFRGPYPAPAIGDLPAGEDWFEDYERNGHGGTYLYKETLAHRVQVLDPKTWLRFGWGRRQWQQFKWNGIAYVQDVDSNGQPYLKQTNTVLNQPCPQPLQLVF